MNSFNILNEFIDSAKRNNLKPTYDELNKHIEYYIKNNKIIENQHWIIRVDDSINFKNSKKSIWGINRGNNNIKSIVQNKLKEGDILWFLTPEQYGKKVIGIAEYTHYYDSEEEPLIKLDVKLVVLNV